jgi:hypothetical protein
VEIRGAGLRVGEGFPLHFGGHDVHQDYAGELEMRWAGVVVVVVDGEAVGDACAAVVAYDEDFLEGGFGVEDRGESFENGSTDCSFGVLACRGEGGYAIAWKLGRSLVILSGLSGRRVHLWDKERVMRCQHWD